MVSLQMFESISTGEVHIFKLYSNLFLDTVFVREGFFVQIAFSNFRSKKVKVTSVIFLLFNVRMFEQVKNNKINIISILGCFKKYFPLINYLFLRCTGTLLDIFLEPKEIFIIISLYKKRPRTKNKKIHV